MGSGGSNIFCVYGLVMLFLATTASVGLSPDFYDAVCPEALPTIKRVVEAAVCNEPRMGASLLRLHFHDCFVNGCDASILLDPSPTIDSEKNALPNAGSVRGFEVIDQIKLEVDQACGGPVVSCADILTLASRDSVVALGGPTWAVPLGRRDSTQAFRVLAENDLPPPSLDLQGLLAAFQKQGLNETDLVALSGGHTIGLARCGAFKDRIYNETNIDPEFAREKQMICPRSGGDGNFSGLDSTPKLFDTSYFTNLLGLKGLLRTDQALFNGSSTDDLVRTYASNPGVFFADFVTSMINMGNIKPLTGDEGQIRVDCKLVNSGETGDLIREKPAGYVYEGHDELK